MKAIQSLGGPLIALPRGQTAKWSGNIGKRFVGDDCHFASDYDAAAFGNNQSREKPWSVASLSGHSAHGLIFSMPYKTQVVFNDPSMVCIAQVVVSDRDGVVADLTRKDFQQAAYDESINFSCDDTGFVLFDAVLEFDEVGEEMLKFELAAGSHILSSALSKQGETRLILYCIRPSLGS